MKRGSRLWIVVLVMMVTLTGCSKTRYVSVRYLPTESLEFFVPLCGDDRLRELWLEDITGLEKVGDGELLWSLQAEGVGARVSRIGFGPAPDGFDAEGLTSLSELVEKYGERELRINAKTAQGSRILAAFTIAELPTDGSAVLQGTKDRVVSVTELQEAQRDQCSPSSADEIATVASRIALAGAAVGGLTWLMLRRRRSGRTSVAA